MNRIRVVSEVTPKGNFVPAACPKNACAPTRGAWGGVAPQARRRRAAASPTRALANSGNAAGTGTGV